jgi:acetyl esterase
MSLDPQARAVLDQMAAIGGPPINELSVSDARKQAADMAVMQGAPEVVAKIEDRKLPSPAGDIRARLYTAAGKGPLPVFVYFHGGGWVIGNIETSDVLCRELCNAAECIVTSVDYRLAPEHPFPAAVEDAYHAALWAAANAASFGGDPSRIAIGGDSAGGNLAAVVAQIARDRGQPALKFQLLIYPATDAACDTPSYSENADGYLLTKDAMQWFWNHYMGSDADRSNPRLSPLRASNLVGLPAALVITAELDPLRDEGERYAKRLQAAGVPAQLTRYDGMMHGFFAMAARIDQGRKAVQQAAAALRTAFAS